MWPVRIIIHFTEGEETSLHETRKKAVIKAVFWVLNIFNDIGKGKVFPLQVADACECGNEPSGSVKCGEFLD